VTSRTTKDAWHAWVLAVGNRSSRHDKQTVEYSNNFRGNKLGHTDKA
jgi:hypothetical protein